MTIEPRNLTAQLHHRAAGNPPSTVPDSAISNCFPGLEFDFRNLWRRIFEGIEVHEANGLVIRAEGALSRLQGRYLISVGGTPNLIGVRGPSPTQDDADLGITWLEWSNFLAGLVASSTGETVPAVFYDPADDGQETVDVRIRPIFVSSAVTGDVTALIDEVIAGPGELTQSLCSPWQNDYRECGCYYWAASRPDYVNVETTATGVSTGNNWMARSREPKQYRPDNPSDASQISYEELFRNWQGLLRFIVKGRDHD
jgi:hypothetical protein